MTLSEIDPLIAPAVLVATACTDAIYVMFTNAVVRQKRLPAAAWSSFWYLLSSFAVINYTHNWVYVLFAAAGSFIGDLPASRTDLSAAAGRLLAGVTVISGNLTGMTKSASDALGRFTTAATDKKLCQETASRRIA
jgi:hypothetical protein